MPWFNNDGSPAGESVAIPENRWLKIPFNLVAPDASRSPILRTGIILPAKRIVFSRMAIFEISASQADDSLEIGFGESGGNIFDEVTGGGLITGSFFPSVIGQQGLLYLEYTDAQKAQIYANAGDKHHVQDLRSKDETFREIKLQMVDNTTGGFTTEGILFLEVFENFID